MTALILSWSATSNVGPVLPPEQAAVKNVTTKTNLNIVRMETAPEDGSRLSRRQRVVHHPSVHDREDGTQRADLLVRHAHRVEIVVAEHDEVAELARLDRPEVLLFLEKPAVLGRVEA